MKRIALEVRDSSLLNANGIRVFIDDYSSKEEALNALHQYVLGNVTYSVCRSNNRRLAVI